MATLDQRRAAYAWSCVRGQSGEYATLTKGAPALIMNNGLMQTLAFYKGKGKPHHLVLLADITQWLGSSSEGLGVLSCPGDYRHVMDALHAAESPAYRRATEETLAVLRWIRQLAQTTSGRGGSS